MNGEKESLPLTPTLGAGTGGVHVTQVNECNIPSDEAPYARSIVALNASNIQQVKGFYQVPKGSYPPDQSCGDHDFGAGVTTFRLGSNGTEMVVAPNKNGEAYAFYASSFFVNGSRVTNVTQAAWTRGVATFDETPFAFDNSSKALFQSGYYINAVYPNNGTTIWSTSTSGFVQAGLVVANGFVIAASNWVNKSGSSLGFYDEASGSLLYEKNISQWIDGEPVVAEGRVFFGAGNANLTGTGHVSALQLPLRAVPGVENVTPENCIPHLQGCGGLVVTLQLGGKGGVPGYNCSAEFNGSYSSSCGSNVFILHPIPSSNSTVSGWLYANDSEQSSASSVWHFYLHFYKLKLCRYFIGGSQCITETIWVLSSCIPRIVTVGGPGGFFHFETQWICGTVGGSPPEPGCKVLQMINCIPDTVGYAMTDPNLTVVGQSWNFGDGSPLNTSYDPSHLYSALGSYPITLSLTDNEANVWSGTFNFEVDTPGS